MNSSGVGPGTLSWTPAAVPGAPLADPVAMGLAALPWRAEVLVAPIDPELADTAEFCARYSVGAAESANCVVVAGRRGDSVRYAACLLLASTRVDVNGVVRRTLDARKASFAPMSDTVAMTGMEYGGITPIGLPVGWPLLVDRAVIASPAVVVGSGVRHSKLCLPGVLVADLPEVEVVSGLAR